MTLDVGAIPEKLVARANLFWMREVLYLLLERALAYSPSEKKISLEVKKVSTAKEEQVLLTITDESPGLEVVGQAKVFDKFADIFINGESPQLKGSGLEFAVCREVMKKLGGQIEIKVSPGVGNKFILKLPLAKEKK